MSRRLLAATLIALPMAALVPLPTAAASPIDPLFDLLDSVLRSLRSFVGLTETIKYSLHYEVTGIPDDSGADWAAFRFDGPVTVATVNADSARWQATSRQVGYIHDWQVSFRYATDAAQPPLNTQSKLDSSQFRLEMNDGSVVTELLDDSSTPLLPETDIPFRGHMIFELGPTTTRDRLDRQHYRVTGCMGVQGIGSIGALAGKRGALCTSGTFNFPREPRTLNDLKGMTLLGGASSFTLVMH